jgi:hypothetical protein
VRDTLIQAALANIIDLCSGASGPLIPVCRELRESGLNVSALMTDKFPNPELCREVDQDFSLRYSADSVDATRVPQNLIGLRTMFNAFHHFRPNEARQILKSAVDAHQPIAIFEVPERTVTNLLATPLIFITAVWAIIRIRPFSFSRMFFSLAVPLIPLSIAWDGMVSNLRTYSVDEALELTRGLDADYHWRAGKVPLQNIPANVTFLIGIPQRPRTESVGDRPLARRE